MGTLYLVSTPIGNLEDITLRALRVLREASLIAAEDTRHTRRLLSHYEITVPCMSYHEHNKYARQNTILDALAAGDVALVSDAGTPALSDPGLELVQACIQAGITVSPIPGPSAPMAALVASGLPTDSVFFIGFLPRRSSERRTLLDKLAPLPATLVCFETPHRLLAALSDAQAVLGNRPIVVAREITKLHEAFIRAPIATAMEHFTAHPPRGEFTLVIAGPHTVPDTDADPAAPDEATIIQRLQALLDQGYRSSDAARLVAKELGIHRRTVYSLALTLKTEQQSEEEEENE
jgi:16S rRNA (cytidine1402-2'-O)-methyltransferase